MLSVLRGGVLLLYLQEYQLELVYRDDLEIRIVLFRMN